MTLLEDDRRNVRGHDPRALSRRWDAENRRSMPPVVKRILIFTVALYLVQVGITHSVTIARYVDDPISRYDAIVNRESVRGNESVDADTRELIYFKVRVSTLQKALELNLPQVKRGEVWRLITYAFCHSTESISHVAFNMFGLFIFGRMLEQRYGSREFFLFYIAAAIASAVAYLALDWWLGRGVPSIGASGSVMGVIMLFTMLNPRQEILLFLVIPVQVRFLCLFIVLYDLYPVLLELGGQPDTSGVAHAAHLGGLAFGFWYHQSDMNLSRLYEDHVANGVARWFLPQPREEAV